MVEIPSRYDIKFSLDVPVFLKLISTMISYWVMLHPTFTVLQKKNDRPSMFPKNKIKIDFSKIFHEDFITDFFLHFCVCVYGCHNVKNILNDVIVGKQIKP
jgi:hypothetical protein